MLSREQLVKKVADSLPNDDYRNSFLNHKTVKEFLNGEPYTIESGALSCFDSLDEVLKPLVLEILKEEKEDDIFQVHASFICKNQPDQFTIGEGATVKEALASILESLKINDFNDSDDFTITARVYKTKK